MEKLRTIVFISYSHDSDRHEEGVRHLADQLRRDGIDCRLDQYVESPPEGWPSWMDQQLEDANFVIVVGSAGYREKVRARRNRKGGHGVRFESVLFIQDLYDSGAWNEKFIPVLLGDAERDDIPKILRGSTYYRADTKEGYENLYRRLTGQPRFVPPSLGDQKSYPPSTPGESREEEPTEDSSSSSSGADGTASESSLQKRLVLPSIILGIVVAVFAILNGALDLREKWPNSRKSGEVADEGAVADPAVGTSEELLSVVIRDQDTREPLEGVEIQVPQYDASTHTNKMGVFEFQLGVPSETMVRVTGFKAGYEPLDRLTTFGGGQEIWQMKPKPSLVRSPSVVKGPFTVEEGKPLSLAAFDATVSVRFMQDLGGYARLQISPRGEVPIVESVLGPGGNISFTSAGASRTLSIVDWHPEEKKIIIDIM